MPRADVSLVGVSAEGHEQRAFEADRDGVLRVVEVDAEPVAQLDHGMTAAELMLGRGAAEVIRDARPREVAARNAADIDAVSDVHLTNLLAERG